MSDAEFEALAKVDARGAKKLLASGDLDRLTSADVLAIIDPREVEDDGFVTVVPALGGKA